MARVEMVAGKESAAVRDDGREDMRAEAMRACMRGWLLWRGAGRRLGLFEDDRACTRRKLSQ